MTIGLLLFAAAFGLTGYNIWDENRAAAGMWAGCPSRLWA